MWNFFRGHKTGYLILTVLLPAFLLTFACSGGGGNSSGAVSAALTEPDTPVNLSIVKSYLNGTALQGTQTTFALSGSDISTGQAYTGVYARIFDGTTTFEGNNVTKTRTVSTLTRTSDKTSANSITSVFSLISNGNLYKSVSSSGVITTPNTQTPLPDSAKVGDTGTVNSTTTSNNTSATTTWKIEGDINGYSKITFTTTSRNLTTNETSLEDNTLYLDSSGTPYKMSVTLVSGSTQLSMSGNKSQPQANFQVFSMQKTTSSFNSPSITSTVKNIGTTTGYNVGCDFHARNASGTIIDTAMAFYAGLGNIQIGDTAQDEAVFFNLTSHNAYTSITYDCSWLTRQ